jgi:hypothetical protein
MKSKGLYSLSGSEFVKEALETFAGIAMPPWMRDIPCAAAMNTG